MSYLAEAIEICRRLVSLHDPDRYLAAQFAPEDRRGYLYALQAFSLEIAGIRGGSKEAMAGDIMPGEIRLQWWREALNGERVEEAKAHPVALALLETIEKNKLPRQAFQDLIDARLFDLYDDLMPDWNALEGYCGETSSALFRMATIILKYGEEPGAADAVGHAGVAYALTGLLRAFPWHARRGQVFLPQSLLTIVGVSREDIIAGKDSEALRAALSTMREKARDHLARARTSQGFDDPQLRPAFLPLASVEGYLKRMERKNYELFVSIIDILQWQRIWRMWRASK
jgi:15-cis-phytoene synthase